MRGDIILRYAGRVIERSSDLPRLVGNTKPGTKASIEVWRAGAARTLDVVVGLVLPTRRGRSDERSMTRPS